MAGPTAPSGYRFSLINPLHRQRSGILGASGARRRWRSPLYLHSDLVGWHSWHPTIAVGAVRETVGLGAAAAVAPGSVRGLFGRTQQVERGHHSNSPPAGDRDSRQLGLVSLGLGTAAQTCRFHRYGALSALSSGCLAHDRRHHLRTHHPSHPVASQAGGCPSRDGRRSEAVERGRWGLI
jgi:hypothetical protein